jgi:transposase
MLELIPRQWKVIQHVREKFVCRACEAITQPPASSHPIARGRAGPKLLAHVLFAKYSLHLPLHRESDVYRRRRNPNPCLCGRAHPRGRHNGAGPGQG